MSWKLRTQKYVTCPSYRTLARNMEEVGEGDCIDAKQSLTQGSMPTCKQVMSFGRLCRALPCRESSFRLVRPLMLLGSSLRLFPCSCSFSKHPATYIPSSTPDHPLSVDSTCLQDRSIDQFYSSSPKFWHRWSLFCHAHSEGEQDSY